MQPEHAQDAAEAAYELHLYISGATPNSTQAVRHLQDICARYLPGRCELQLVDICQQPELAEQEGIVAVPTLVKKRPGLVRFLVGDLSDRRRVLAVLGLAPAPNDPYLHD